MAAPPGRGKPKKFVKCDRCGHKKHQKTSVCPSRYRHLKPREANALIARERAERAADRNRDDTDDDDDQQRSRIPLTCSGPSGARAENGDEADVVGDCWLR